jgi:hypothetical protein
MGGVAKAVGSIFSGNGGENSYHATAPEVLKQQELMKQD